MTITLALSTYDALTDAIEARTGQEWTSDNAAFLTLEEQDMLAAKLYSGKTAAHIVATELDMAVKAAADGGDTDAAWAAADRFDRAYYLAWDLNAMVSPF
jgi:hypothetical protein